MFILYFNTCQIGLPIFLVPIGIFGLVGNGMVQIKNRIKRIFLPLILFSPVSPDLTFGI
ncbi:hypothetical protein FC43_GL001467 [Limosilactobacillus ingluviei DSM 15946]|uniref:Uncharacterized protein n=1 Tax=Limosilactobacillus ingluviei DSM 15946 TaxID=1423760 RepID=A0A0R1UGI0_9LACO|nr:hypothetical protein FC43_GL001467 [Limosilactobacillus ingluviei DSM 15946]